MKPNADPLYQRYKRRALYLVEEAKEGRDWGTYIICDPQRAELRRSRVCDPDICEVAWPIPSKGTTLSWLLRKYDRWLSSDQCPIEFTSAE